METWNFRRSLGVAEGAALHCDSLLVLEQSDARFVRLPFSIYLGALRCWCLVRDDQRREPRLSSYPPGSLEVGNLGRDVAVVEARCDFA